MAGSRVLVVEDDQSLRDVIAEALSEDGYSVKSADNGQAALELARGWAPELVILDLMMPKLDGEQFCGAMREMHGLQAIPIIVVSASRSAQEIGARLGATVSLRKPFDLFELTEHVSQLLG